MAANAGSSVLRQLRFVVASWREDGRTDVELLHRFIQSRDEQAFTTLVGRHGELVWSVCLRVLRNRADAEDALQATFLRLARDAGRIANREAVAGWLFRVARDCAIDLRRSILRQRRIEERLAAASGRAENEQPPTDLRLLLDDALARLSSTERSVLVLVCLEGRTYSDAALEMGCSVAAVHRRFLRAQTRLRRLFARRRRGFNRDSCGRRGCCICSRSIGGSAPGVSGYCREESRCSSGPGWSWSSLHLGSECGRFESGTQRETQEFPMINSQPGTWHADPAHFARPTRRDFLRVGWLGGLGLTLGAVPEARSRGQGRRPGSQDRGEGQVGHSHLPAGRLRPHGQLRPEAGRAGGVSRHPRARSRRSSPACGSASTWRRRPRSPTSSPSSAA